MIAHVTLMRRLPRRLDVLNYAVPVGMCVRRGDLVLVPFRAQQLRGVVTRVEDQPPEKLRPISQILTSSFLSEINLAVLEETAIEIVQSLSSLLQAAFPSKKISRPALVHYPPISVKREEIPSIQEAVAVAMQGTAFVQVTDIVQATAIAYAILKKEPHTFVLVPNHHDASLLPSRTRLGALTIPSDTRQILVLHSGASEHAQYDRNPRYDAREVALHFAKRQSCPIAFFDVSPRVADLFQCDTILSLADFFRPAPIYVDLKHERGKIFFLLSSTLLESIAMALHKDKKVILSYNRKGMSRSLECRDCGWIAETRSTPEHCITCQSTRLTARGIGNQILERELKKQFPHVPVVRVERGHSGEMPAKGGAILLVTQYYFESVLNPLEAAEIGLVADVRGDLGLLDPWYTSTEQTLAKLCFLQGLAWRAKAPCLIQAFDLPIIKRMMVDPIAYMRSEMETRRTFGYPPFHALYRVAGKLINEASIDFAQLKQLDDHILIERNPEKPV